MRSCVCVYAWSGKEKGINEAERVVGKVDTFHTATAQYKCSTNDSDFEASTDRDRTDRITSAHSPEKKPPPRW